MNSHTYDLAVVGGGIAGLAIAEIFARSGRRVVLLERDQYLCQEASASHHGWFHFGSLYSMFPQNQFLRTMVGGVEDLLEYYSAFSGMNITVSPAGQLMFPQEMGRWFRDEPIEYIVAARNNPDFNMRSFEGVTEYAQKIFFLITWEIAIKQFISRHQRYHKHNWAGRVSASQWIPRAGWSDYSRDVISKPDISGISLNRDTHFKITGYDRPMQATAIITDLASSLLAAGGEVLVSNDVDRIKREGDETLVIIKNGGEIKARQVVVSAGKWLGDFLGDAGKVSVVASPLIVTYPAVSDRHFVRMTPFVSKSINHLHHEVDGHSYSLIGGGYAANPHDEIAITNAKEQLLEMAKNVFPKLSAATVIESYLGFKTEIIAKSGERNYQYIVREVDKNVFAVLPGKFSLAFSLAVNTFKKLTGDMPRREVNEKRSDAVQNLVKPTRHAQLILSALS